jgi:hypothetical protein
MGVDGNLVDRERDIFRAPGFRQNIAVALMDRNSTAEIRQRERFLAIAAISGADELKKGFVFRDRQKLPIAEHPAHGRETAREHPDFTNVRLCHKRESVSGWKDALQCDAETQGEERLPILMRLASADIGDGSRVHRGKIGNSVVRIVRPAEEISIRRGDPTGRDRRGGHDMGMGGHLGDRDRNGLCAGTFTQVMARAYVNRRTAAEVGQCEGRLTIATEGRAQERKERLVLIDRQELTVAERPTFRREHETHYTDFG